MYGIAIDYVTVLTTTVQGGEGTRVRTRVLAGTGTDSNFTDMGRVRVQARYEYTRIGPK